VLDSMPESRSSFAAGRLFHRSVGIPAFHADANFYRLKVGSILSREVFSVGGRRGEIVETSLGQKHQGGPAETPARNVHRCL